MIIETDHEILRRVQLEQLGMLIEFDRICKENNLSYQLFAGTLLGAIRHNGFIPWDDDIDVAMLRDDYEKFINICNDNLSPDYFLQNYKTDPYYFRQFSRIRKNNTKYVQDLYKNLEIHHGIFIDVFPLDGFVPGSIFEVIRVNIIKIMYYLNRGRNNTVSDKASFIKKAVGKLFMVTNLIINKPTFDELKTKIIKINSKKNTKYITHLTNAIDSYGYKSFLIKKENFMNVIEWEFEKNKFPVPYTFHKYLTNIYGDYMKLPPKEQRKPHHGVIEIKIN